MTAPPPPQPLYFGAPGEALFGWLHRPPADSSSGLGLVVCNPFGFEEVCAHRSLRRLAMAAAASGVPTLRFDYAGCGNSEGDEFEPQRLAHWLRSVHAAVDALKQASGLAQMCLLGLRWGAALAALAAAERDDVAGLIAIAPVVRGRTYLRELTILGEAGAAASSTARTRDGLLESAGFVLTSEASESLAGVDLRRLAQRPAPRVLIVERDDMPYAADWAPELERLGAEVQTAHWAGYAGMMRDPQRAEVPQQIVEGVVACLEVWQPSLALPAPQERPLGSSSLLLAGPPGLDGAAAWRETAVHIDNGASQLFGILSTEAGHNGAARPAVLMLNSGSVHHIGPNRLWVRLARQWAACGITVLRLDISGIGDSPPRPGAQENVVYSPHAGADIEAALAYLRTQVGATECHALGLCSGAYHVLKAAVAGQPLASAVMVNPLTYFWNDGTGLADIKDYELIGLVATYRKKLFTRGPWKKLFHGQADVKVFAQVALRRFWSFIQPQLRELARVLHIRFRDDLARDFALAVQQGIRLKFVFAAHAPGSVLLQQQSGCAMKRLLQRRQVSLDFVPGADHTFTRHDARERLVALLNARMLAELTPPSHLPP